MSKNRVIILANEADVHARSVARHLERDLDCQPHILDLASLTNDSFLHCSVQPANDGDDAVFRRHNQDLPLHEVSAVWYRRPAPPPLDHRIADPFDREFACREWKAAFDSILRSQVEHWVNRPEADFLAAGKPHQLLTARAVGLQVPKTLLSNRQEQVQPFLEACDGEVIFKTMRTHPRRFLETRVLTPEALKYLPFLQMAPCIFQQRIRAKVDLRVTIVGPQMFTCAIHSPDSAYPVDSRLDMGVKHEAIDLDPALERQLRALMERLGLTYGAVDLMVTPDDEVYFLEVNPGGQFLYVEMLTQLPISRAFAELLRDPEGYGAPRTPEQRPTSAKRSRKTRQRSPRAKKAGSPKAKAETPEPATETPEPESAAA